MSTPKKSPMSALAPLDSSAFQAAAVAIPEPVRAVLSTPASPAVSPVETRPGRGWGREKAHGKPNGSSATQPSRAGKVQLSVWVGVEKRRDLKRRALDLGRPVDEIVNELIDGFLRRG